MNAIKPEADPAYQAKVDMLQSIKAEIRDGHLQDRGFCSDMLPLLRTGIKYDAQAAGKYVKIHLLNLLPA